MPSPRWPRSTSRWTPSGTDLRGEDLRDPSQLKLPNSDTQGGSQSGGGATNVVVYNVIIDVENTLLKLRPAMTANVNFVVARESDVLKVANSGPPLSSEGMSPEEIRALMRGGGGTAPAGRRGPAPPWPVRAGSGRRFRKLRWAAPGRSGDDGVEVPEAPKRPAWRS